jgi:hypothetical protein
MRLRDRIKHLEDFRFLRVQHRDGLLDLFVLLPQVRELGVGRFFLALTFGLLRATNYSCSPSSSAISVSASRSSVVAAFWFSLGIPIFASIPPSFVPGALVGLVLLVMVASVQSLPVAAPGVMPAQLEALSIVVALASSATDPAGTVLKFKPVQTASPG